MPDRPLRFIHTADWQLGLRARFIPGDAGALVRDARLRTVRRIGIVAKEQLAEFVVAAGDVFQNHGLRPDTLRQTFDVLREFPVPVYLLPGNHDPYTPDSLYRSNLWHRECPDNVHVLGSTEPVQVREDAHLLPCPILERQVFDDPTAHLAPSFGPQEGFRIGVVHGGIREILEHLDPDYDPVTAIGLDTRERGGLDYLALGDWHGLLDVDAYTRYPGAPEATRFKEKEPGHVLAVTLTAAGDLPDVQPIEVQTQRWLRLEEEIEDSDGLDALQARLEAIPDKRETLIELHLTGTLEMAPRARLEDDIIDPARDRFRWLRLRDEHLHTVLRDEDLDDIAREGWIRDVVDRLRQDPADDANLALRILYRLNREVTS